MLEGERICFWLCVYGLPALLLLSTWTTECEGMFPAEALQFNAALESSLQHRHSSGGANKKTPHTAAHTTAEEGGGKRRTKRGAIWDFFQKIGITTNLVVDQYVDTRNTLNEVYNLVNAGFSDPTPDKPTLRPPTSTTAKDLTSSEEMTTTTEKYQISRYEFGRILGRNFRGLQRLMHIELQDAFNQSKYNIQEYQAEARKQFRNSIAVEKKMQLHQKLKG